MSLRNALLHRALDLAGSEPALRAVHRVTGIWTRAAVTIRRGAADRLGRLGLATRVDHARLEDELERLGDATRSLAEAVTRLEATISSAESARPAKARTTARRSR